MNSKLAVLIIAGALAGCGGSNDGIDTASSVSAEVRNKIALCSAGIGRSVGVGLEAKIGKDLSEGGKISATLENELRGLFITVEGQQPTAEAVQLHKSYVDCLNRQ